MTSELFCLNKIDSYHFIFRPTIIVFDSLLNYMLEKKQDDVSILIDYLSLEYSAKLKKKFTEENLKVEVPIVPKQYNGTDCGVFLLK